MEYFILLFIGNAKLKTFLFSIYLSWNILQQNVTCKRISRENGKKWEKNGKKFRYKTANALQCVKYCSAFMTPCGGQGSASDKFSGSVQNNGLMSSAQQTISDKSGSDTSARVAIYAQEQTWFSH